MHQNDGLKEKVAQKSFEYLLNDIKVNKSKFDSIIWLGIGSGTTIKFFISILGKKFSEGVLPFHFVTISSSIDSETSCRESNLPIRQLADLPKGKKLDYYIDGADEVDNFKRSLKGLGGASTREKLLRTESDKFYILIDKSKRVINLCTDHPIVFEILPFGYEKTLERIMNITPKPAKIEIRKGTGKMGYVITDNSNYLVDVYFSQSFEESFDLIEFEKKLKTIPGVIETGLFASPADVVFVASSSEEEIIV